MGSVGISMIFNDARSIVKIVSKYPDANERFENLISSSSLQSVISSFRPFKCDCASMNITNITQNVQQILQAAVGNSSKASSVKLGVAYNTNFLECPCHKDNFNFSSYDLVIFEVELTPLTTMLSYEHFTKMMQKALMKNREYALNRNISSTLYIRLVSGNWKATIHPAYYKRYEALVAKYGQKWIDENNDTEMFIIPPYPKNVVIYGDNRFLKKRVTALYDEKQFHPLFHGPGEMCDIQEHVTLLLSVFKNILFQNPSYFFAKKLTEMCKLTNESVMYHFQANTINLNFLFYLQRDGLLSNLESFFVTLLSDSAIRNVSTVYLGTAVNELLEVEYTWRDGSKIESWTFVQNITFGCYIHGNAYYGMSELFERNTSNFLHHVDKHCQKLFDYNKTTNVLIHFTWNDRYNIDEYLLAFLTRIQDAKMQFRKQSPGADLTPLLVIPAFDKFSYLCDDKVKLLNERYQTILSFANVHNWKRLVVLPLSSIHSSIGHAWWDYLRTDAELAAISKQIPIYFRTNSAKSLEKELPMTYSCMNVPKDPNPHGIDFIGNPYSGAYFLARLRNGSQLEMRELQSAMLYALGRFSSVELLVNDWKDFEMGSMVLNQINLNANKNISNTTSPLIYIEVPITEAFAMGRHFAKFTNHHHTGVHVSGWEPFYPEVRTMNKMLAINNESYIPVNFGISVQNCSHEITLGLVRLKNLPIFKMASYIVCNVNPVIPDSVDAGWVEYYLATLFYTKVYMERFLRTERKFEVMFRINLASKTTSCFPGTSDHTKEFLMFIGHLNQHSATYKIRYFMVKAFEVEMASKACTYSWWRIDEYTNLTNPSVFVEKENEYFGRSSEQSMRLPSANSTTNDGGSDKKAIYYATIIPVAILLGVAIFVLIVQRFYYRNRYLTEREINQFYNGNGLKRNEIMLTTTTDCPETMYMKFLDKYEIKAKDIEMGDILASGQFGVVFKGTLRETEQVAIKIPRSDCSKEQFKSTLAEVKLLCYISDHPNIVTFLGASTKKIGNGELHIVMEYCSNGSLQSYLRKIQKSGGETSSVHTVQLNMFAYQIASGMDYLAEKRVIHGDLAARNVLVTEELTCKIADFGLSRRLYELNEYKKTGNEPLPWRWMAPESLSTMEFTTKSDVWSYGITLWEVFSLGKIPYPDKSWNGDFICELENGMRLGKAQFASEDIHEKMLQCWSLAQQERPDFAQMKEYFAGLRNEEYAKLA